jgi:hypothetical protein
MHHSNITNFGLGDILFGPAHHFLHFMSSNLPMIGLGACDDVGDNAADFSLRQAHGGAESSR